MQARAGRRWYRVGGALMQIDSGPFGIVWGVNRNHQIYCRTGITAKNPRGRGWLGCWGVNKNHQIFYRYGVSRRRPQGGYSKRIYIIFKMVK